MGEADSLREKIGFWEAFSIGVGGMIGGGIFAVLGLSVEFSRNLAPFAFLISGIIAFLTSYSYAKLTMKYPSKGGTIEFLVKAYGTGVFSGTLNLLLLASYVIMISLYAYAFGSYASAIVNVNAHFLKNILISLPILVFTIINALGAYASGKAEDALVAFKVVVLIVVASAGLTHVNPERFSYIDVEFIDLIVGGMVIFLAYEGFELIANAGSDVENPETLKKAFYSSVLFVIAIYVLIAIVAVGNLSYDEIISSRDYALAEAAKPSLGNIGFLLVTFAAVVSTSSAINATLYGAAGVSYMVAKYGQLPEVVEKPIWGKAYEGLVAISLLSLLLANTASLEEISTAGSSGFLLIFFFVNLAAFKLRKNLKIRAEVPLIGAVVSFVAFLILIFKMVEKDIASVYIFSTMIIGCFLLEYAYRLATGRRMELFVDSNLKNRMVNLANWEKWVKKFADELVKLVEDAEVFIVGSHARGEREKAHDVDLLIFTEERDESKFEKAKRNAGLTKVHPLHLHVESKRRKEIALRRAKHYVQIKP